MIYSRKIIERFFVTQNFRALLAVMETESGVGVPMDDFRRVVFAYALYSADHPEMGRELLAGITGDGTVATGDVAFLRAFELDLSGDRDGAIALLLQNIGGTSGMLGVRIRLRAGDLLVRAGRYDEVEETLGPLLLPPGGDDTLEAQLILIEAILGARSPHERIVEQASLIDLMLERGFTLTVPSQVLYYADFLAAQGIEPLVQPLLLAHRSLLENYRTSIPSEIQLLLELGNKHQVPEAVRAAGRSYQEASFPWDDRMDPTEAAYYFATHEEHEASRLSLLLSVPAEELEADPEMWGPHLLETFLAGHWELTLETLDRRTEDLRGHPAADQLPIMRAVSLYKTGHPRECIDVIEANLAAFLDRAVSEELAVYVLAHLALRDAAGVDRALRALAPRLEDEQSLDELWSAVVMEVILRDDSLAITTLLGKDLGIPLSILADNSARTSMGWGAQACMNASIELLSRGDDPGRTEVLRGLRAAWFHADSQELDRAMSHAIQLAGDQPRRYLILADWAWMLILLGRYEEALPKLEECIENPEKSPLPLVYPRLDYVMGKLGVDEEELEKMRRRARSWLTEKRTPEEVADLQIVTRNAYEGDSQEIVLERLHHLLFRDPQGTEIVRHARLVARRPMADRNVKQWAESILEMALAIHATPGWEPPPA